MLESDSFTPFYFTDSSGIRSEIFWHGGLRFDAFADDPGPAFAHYLSADDSTAATYAEQYEESRAEVKPFEIQCLKLLDLTGSEKFAEWVVEPPGGYSSEWGRRASCAHSSFDLRSGGPVVRRAWAAGFDGIAFWDTDAYNREATLSIAIRSGRQARLAAVPEFSEPTLRGYRVRGADSAQIKAPSVVPRLGL